MAGTLSEFAALDDIGFIGIGAGRRYSTEDRAEIRKAIDEYRTARAGEQAAPQKTGRARMAYA